jgi:hypothetical protein
MKRKIDIEKLLHWAVRDELPKGRAVSASPWDVITQFGTLGTVVQTGGYGDGFGFVSGEPHGDALIVAQAVRGLDQEARFKDIEDVHALFGDLLGIAGEAPRLILGSLFDPQRLVVSYATRGTRPSWKFEPPSPLQMFAPTMTGRPRPIVYGTDAHGDLVELKPNRGRKAQRELYDVRLAPRSPLNWHDPSPLHIGECRGEWVTWHGALVRLAGELDGKLKLFDVEAPALPLLPWRDDTAPARIIKGRNLARPGVDHNLTPRRDRPVGKPVESPIEAETVASYARASRTKMRKIAAA